MSGDSRFPEVSLATRRTMQSNRGRDTGPEMAVRRILHAHGLRYRVAGPLPFDPRRRADIHFIRVGLYVFIDGCYWHGCPDHYVEPKTNVEFWRLKIASNRRRDHDTTHRLKQLGYKVLRYWEHDDAGQVASAVEERYRQLLAGDVPGAVAMIREESRWL